MAPKITARRLTVIKDEQTLTIDWADGHCTVYPLDGLRRACPCATCRGHENMGELPDPDLFRAPALRQWNNLRLEPTGQYALQFIWDDGHKTGFYTWQRLRAMCPCEQCRGLMS